jgi:hypothetical protein
VWIRSGIADVAYATKNVGHFLCRVRDMKSGVEENVKRLFGSGSAERAFWQRGALARVNNVRRSQLAVKEPRYYAPGTTSRADISRGHGTGLVGRYAGSIVVSLAARAAHALSRGLDVDTLSAWPFHPRPFGYPHGFPRSCSPRFSLPHFKGFRRSPFK